MLKPWANAGLWRDMSINTLPRPVIVLGLSGILPQIACLVAVLLWPEWRWVALAAACFYAALIFSFLGGLWWMQALVKDERRWQPYLLSVVASIGGWISLLPWCLGWTWPGPALLVLGLAVLLSPMADRRLAAYLPVPAGWLQLRAMMATGLGVLTLILGLIA